MAAASAAPTPATRDTPSMVTCREPDVRRFRSHAYAPTRLLQPHGWPDSFWRYTKVIPLLTDPGAPAPTYAGLRNGAMWHATNYGDAWQQSSVNLGGIARTPLMLP